MKVSIQIMRTGETLVFDELIGDVQYSRTKSASDFPIEGGVDGVDNVRRNAFEWRCTVMISETPTGDANGTPLTGGRVGPERILDALAFLDRALGEKCEIVLPKIGVVGPVWILDDSPKLGKEGRGVFTLAIREAREVFAHSITTERVTVKKPATPDLEPEEEAGEIPTEEDLGGSWLASGLRLLRGGK